MAKRQEETAEELCMKAAEYRRLGRLGDAMNCYAEAARLDPDSPAAEAWKMLADIMNFYHKDYYNP